MKKMKKFADGGLSQAGLEAGLEKMMREMEASSYEKKKKPLPADDISSESKIPRPNLTDRAKGALGAVKDEYMRGVKRIGQDLGIAKDENQYEDKARMESIRQAVKRGSEYKKGGKVKSTSSYKSGGKVSSASKRGDGCAVKGKTKGRMI
jgi:hypothetical protein